MHVFIADKWSNVGDFEVKSMFIYLALMPLFSTRFQSYKLRAMHVVSKILIIDCLDKLCA